MEMGKVGHTCSKDCKLTTVMEVGKDGHTSSKGHSVNQRNAKCSSHLKKKKNIACAVEIQ